MPSIPFKYLLELVLSTKWNNASLYESQIPMSKQVVWIFKEDHWISLQSELRHWMWTYSLLKPSHSFLENFSVCLCSWPPQDSEGKRLKYHHYNSVSSDLPITTHLPSPPLLKAPIYYKLWNLALMFRLTSQNYFTKSILTFEIHWVSQKWLNEKYQRSFVPLSGELNTEHQAFASLNSKEHARYSEILNTYKLLI